MKGWDHYKVFVRGMLGGKFSSFLKIITMFDDLGTPRAHGGIFLNRISMRDNNRRSHAKPAGSVRNALSMIATCCTDHPAVHINGVPQISAECQTTTDLKGPQFSVVFMLHIQRQSRCTIQKRPTYRRGWRNMLMHKFRRIT